MILEVVLWVLAGVGAMNLLAPRRRGIGFGTRPTTPRPDISRFLNVVRDEDPFPSRLARGGYQPPPGGKPPTNPPTGGSNVTPPPGMSAEEAGAQKTVELERVALDWMKRYDAKPYYDGKVYSLMRLIERREDAARADERAKLSRERKPMDATEYTCPHCRKPLEDKYIEHIRDLDRGYVDQIIQKRAAEARAAAAEVKVRNEVLEMCAVDDEKAAEILVNPSKSPGATETMYSWKHIEYSLRESAERHRKLKVFVLDKDESVEPSEGERG